MAPRTRCAVIICAVIAYGPCVSKADARRHATPVEARGMIEAQGSVGREKIPLRCITAYISTADRRWGLWYFRLADRSCMRWLANGIAIARRASPTARHWRSVLVGSDITCADTYQIPDAVALDLHLC